MKVKIVGGRKVIPMKEVPVAFYNPERDGVTFSLLTTFKNCREKARLFLNGWTGKQNSLGTIFGGLVHGVNERMYLHVQKNKFKSFPGPEYIKDVCREVEALWKKENPRADAESLKHLEFSMILLEGLMPWYFKYWKKDFQFVWDRVEHTFKMPFKVDHPFRPGTSMKTFVRGKMDGSFRRKLGARPWLFETKTKAQLSEQNESDLADILSHELQANIYLLYLRWVEKVLPEGLLYNIIRRPALRQKKKETVAQFAKRVAIDVRRRPEHYFVRMQMSVERKDLERNEGELHDLVSDFLFWWNGIGGHYKNSDHCQNKYGRCHNLPICSRGDYSGFYKRTTVFRELADEL